MSDLPNIAKLLEAIGSILWPIILAIVVLKLWPVVESILSTAKSWKFTIKVAGQEISMEEANQQNRSLIEDLQARVIELTRALEKSETPPKQVPSQKTALSLHHFSGDDLGLQKSRISLADNISTLIESGLNDYSLPQIQQLIIAQHTAAWQYLITASKVPDHLEESEALYNYLMQKLIGAPPTRYHGEVASALGIMKHNMLSRIRGMRTKTDT